MGIWKTIPLTEKSRVIIHIWLPRINGKICSLNEFIKACEGYSQHHDKNIFDPDRSHIGHAAVETNNKYVSWWPAKSPNATKLHKLIWEITESQTHDYKQDCKEEDCEPHVKVCLYSLNSNEINNSFTEIQNSNCGYVLMGDKPATRLYNMGEKGQSCCGIAYEVLEAGGILKLSRFYQDITIKWLYSTPENLAELVKHAKQEELAKYPETQNFARMSNEYVPLLQPQITQCEIM